MRVNRLKKKKKKKKKEKGLVINISIKFVDFLKKIIILVKKNPGIFSLAPRMQVIFGPHNAGLLTWEMQCQKNLFL